MEPRVVDNPPAGRFEILLDEEVVGYAEYQRNGDGLALTHTSIDPSFEGRGFGSTLIRGVLDAVRERGGSALPYCPFIRGYIRRHPEYLDLVPPEGRVRFQLSDADTERDNGTQ